MRHGLILGKILRLVTTLCELTGVRSESEDYYLGQALTRLRWLVSLMYLISPPPAQKNVLINFIQRYFSPFDFMSGKVRRQKWVFVPHMNQSPGPQFLVADPCSL